MSEGAPRPVVLVTRPEPAASALASALAAEGWAPVLSPVLAVREIPWDGAAGDAAALALTSAAAARAAPRGAGLRALPVWAVGEATAEAARAAGFGTVTAGPADAAALAREIAAALPAGAEVLHLRGRHGTAGFAEALEAAGLRVREGVVYEMRAAEALDEAAARALAAGRVRAAPVYSPRSGRALAALAAPFDLSRVTALAISEAAAAPLRAAGFARVEIAEAPTGEAMRAALSRLRAAAEEDRAGGAVIPTPDLLTFSESGADGTQEAEMSDRTDPEGETPRKAREGGATPAPGDATEAAPRPEDAAEDAAPEAEAHEPDGYHDDLADHEHYPEEPRTSLAARTLQILGVLLVGGAAALWFGPRLAPNLPAPVAAWLTPPEMVEAEDLAALRRGMEAEFDERLAALETRMAERAADGGGTEAEIAALRADLEALSARIGAAPPSELSGRLEQAETMLSGVAARLDALSAGLEDVEGGGEIPPEAMERLAAFSSAVEGLKAEFASLGERVSALSRRIDEAEANFEAGLRQAMDTAAAAEAAAEAEIAAAETAAAAAERRAALDAGFAALAEAMATGDPFADALGALAAEGEPPAALAEAAADGVPTLAALREDFKPAAHAALEAASKAEAGDDSVSRFMAGMRARLGGVPLGEVEGDGPDAALGRAAARLSEGDVAAALEALETLPAAAQEALGDWRRAAEARVAAERAMADWRAELGEGG